MSDNKCKIARFNEHKTDSRGIYFRFNVWTQLEVKIAFSQTKYESTLFDIYILNSNRFLWGFCFNFLILPHSSENKFELS